MNNSTCLKQLNIKFEIICVLFCPYSKRTEEHNEPSYQMLQTVYISTQKQLFDIRYSSIDKDHWQIAETIDDGDKLHIVHVRAIGYALLLTTGQ